MFCNLRIPIAAAMAAGLLAMAAPAQERRSRIDVEQYTIDAEITPDKQFIAAKAVVRFTPLDDNVASAAFDLNNALNAFRIPSSSSTTCSTSTRSTAASTRPRWPT